MQRFRLAAILLSALPLAALPACRTPMEAATAYELARRQQKYSLEVVRERAKQLEVGMTRIEVLTLLGSPGVDRDRRWIYVPDEGGAIVPVFSLLIEFDAYGRYVGKRDVLGLGE